MGNSGAGGIGMITCVQYIHPFVRVPEVSETLKGGTVDAPTVRYYSE